MDNPYCKALGIDVPRVEDVIGHREGKPFALLLTALLEAGGPLTLEQVAERLIEAGFGPARTVALALKRCRPAHPPVYRLGDLYHLDPFDSDLGLWAFRLGLRPARGRFAAAAAPVAEEGADLTTSTHSEGAGAGLSQWSKRKDAEAAPLAALKRAVLSSFPVESPAALVLFDVDSGRVEHFTGEQLSEVPERLSDFDALAGVEIRPILLGLGIDFRALRLHELSPPQKTMKVSEVGSPLKITMEHLLRGSCGIKRSLTDRKTLQKLHDAGSVNRLADRLERDVMDLSALYHYGRVQGAVRLRWRNWDERFAVPWSGFDEWNYWRWIEVAREAGQALEIATLDSVEADDPWACAEWCTVYKYAEYQYVLVTADRQPIEESDIQRIRFARPGAWHAPLPRELACPSTESGPPEGSGQIMRVRVSLRDIRPLVWRVIEVPSDYSFWDLHVAIQDAFGWLDYHLHSFRVRDPTCDALQEIGIPVEGAYDDIPEPLKGWRVPVLKYLNLERPECDYEYDFGDSWEHRIKIESIEPADPEISYPRCVDGRHARPPEDVGGVGGYARMLEILSDPSDEEYESYLEWLGGPFDPNAFDRSAVTFDDPGERWALAFGIR